MKRKLLCTILTVSILFSGCGASDSFKQGMEDGMNGTPKQSTETTQPASEKKVETETSVETEAETEKNVETESQSEEPASNILLDAKVKTEDVKNGSGTDTVGTRAYIKAKKADLKNISADDFSAFCDYVKTCDYNWFTIVCDDGTGIVFNGCDVSIIQYGELDDTGRSDKTLGYIRLKDGVYSYEEASN